MNYRETAEAIHINSQQALSFLEIRQDLYTLPFVEGQSADDEHSHLAVPAQTKEKKGERKQPLLTPSGLSPT